MEQSRYQLTDEDRQRSIETRKSKPKSEYISKTIRIHPVHWESLENHAKTMSSRLNTKHTATDVLRWLLDSFMLESTYDTKTTERVTEAVRGAIRRNFSVSFKVTCDGKEK